MTFQLMPKALQRLSLQINIMLSCLLGKFFPLIGLDIYSNVNKQIKMLINSKIYN